MTTYEDTAQALVQNRFDDLETYADTSFNLVDSYVENLSTMLTSLTIRKVDEEGNPVDEDATSNVLDITSIGDITIPSSTPIDYTARPTLGAGIFTPIETTPPEDIDAFNDIDSADLSSAISTFDAGTTGVPGEFIENTVTMGSIVSVEKPSEVSLEAIDKPVKPDIIYPTEPILAAIQMPEKISIDLDSFDAISPGAINVSDPALMSYTAGNYSSELSQTLVELIASGFASAEVYSQLILDSSTDSLDVIINKLLDVGSSGINNDVEQLIYDRGKARLKTENEALYQQTLNEFGSNGFNLPNGIFAANVVKIQKKISDKNDLLNYEIIVNQSNLAQTNRQFMVEKAIQLETVLINFFNDTENRTLESAKAVAANGVDVLRALIESYNAKLELYKTEAGVFELKVRAELNAAEIYKTEMQGVAIESEAQKNTVDLYVKKVDAVKSKAEVYKIEMDGASISMQIEQLKLQQLEVETKIYLANLEAERLKVTIYKEQNEAEKVRLEGHLAKIETYKIKVLTEKEKLDAHFEEKRLLLQENSSLIAKYQADTNIYSAELQANNNFNEQELRAFQMSVSAYEAETDADKVKNLTKIEESKIKIQEAQIKLDQIKSELELTVKGYIAVKELQIKGTEGIMNVGAQLAASSMNAANASASYDFSSTQSGNWSYHPDVAASETEYHYYKEK